MYKSVLFLFRGYVLRLCSEDKFRGLTCQTIFSEFLSFFYAGQSFETSSGQSFNPLIPVRLLTSV
ncbi:hypothetical protein HanIR_Chr13g0618141 [Helianthus annuus]|nr:hypothetical protein HanIR_Chr13g0618141 [Helianthus annuus]